MTTSVMRQYIDGSRAIIDRIEATQLGAIDVAATRCSQAILAGGLVHVFGSGHSRMAVEEMWPRYGSFPGFHTIVELSLTFHNQVVGANGQRQAMLIEGLTGLAKTILRNFRVDSRDVMLVFSTSGTNVVPVEMAIEARQLGLYTIGVMSFDHCRLAAAKGPAGKKLLEVVDLAIDSAAEPGDAMVDVPGLAWPVGPGSTIGNTIIANALKCRVAELLTAAGKPPYVLTSSLRVGAEESARLFNAAYDDHRDRVRRL